MNISDFTQWYYLIYLLPGGISLLVLLLSAVGGGLRHHHGSGGHGHHAHPGHAPVATAHGSGHHGRVHSGRAHSHPPRAPQTASGAAQLLTFFGVGRVPPPLLWGSFLLGWGMFGFWATETLQGRWHHPILFVLPACGIALAGALVTEKLTAEAGARLLPRTASSVTTPVELCGLRGTVVFPVDEARGRVHVYDAYGTMHDLSARTAAGCPPAARGAQVLVTDYDAVRRCVIVEE